MDIQTPRRWIQVVPTIFGIIALLVALFFYKQNSYYNEYTIFHFADGSILGYFEAEGVWKGNVELYPPHQKTHIECWKSDMKCTAFTAGITKEKIITTDVSSYEIDRWDDKEIVTKPEDSGAGCTRYIMRIDLLQKQVTASRATISNEGSCSMVSKDPFNLYLDGVR